MSSIPQDIQLAKEKPTVVGAAPLTIHVPLENKDYAPPTPPLSAEFPSPAHPAPTIPPRRQSLTPVATPIISKRASAPVQSWSARAITKDSSGGGGSTSASLPPQAPAPTTPLPAVPETQPISPENGEMTPKAVDPPPIMATTSSSSNNLAKRKPVPAFSTPPQQGPPLANSPSSTPSRSLPSVSTGSLVPPEASARQRRKSSPQEPQPRVRNSPSHVSLIDFESSDDDDDGGDMHDGRHDKDSSTPSIPEEGEEPGQEESEDPDLARWAPEPAFVPAHIPIANASANAYLNRATTNGYPSHSHKGPSSTKSHSSLRSDRDVPGHRTNGTLGLRQSPSREITNAKHHALLGLSALPNELVQKDVDYTLRALMSPAVFTRMLAEPLARQRFREFLASDGQEGVNTLDFWTDVEYLSQTMERLRTTGTVFRELYMSGGSDAQGQLTPEGRRELRSVLQQILATDTGLVATQTHLVDQMYNNQFQRFVKHQIIQEAHVALGRANLNLASAEIGEGLGDTFVLTNPRLPDHPIVLVSDGFVAVTGYPRSQIVGRNCRFLQGPGTPPASVQRIRDGLNSGKGCTELLLNYRRDGEPFYCLLCIIPVRDAAGTIVYFIGGQTNVSGLLLGEKGHNLGLSSMDSPSNGSAPRMSMSPTMAALCGTALDPTLAPKNGAAGANRIASGVSMGGSGSAGSRTGSGFLKGLFGRHASTSGTGLGYGSERAVGRVDGNGNPKQVIAGAEATFNGPGERRFHDQYAIFQHTYNKVLIFKLKKREITFVSPQMLAFLGLPTRTKREELASSLIRSDVVSIVTAGEDKGETRRMREELKDAIKRGVPCSMYCGFKLPSKGLLTRNSPDSRYKFGMMHVTPIKDGDNSPIAFVAICG